MEFLQCPAGGKKRSVKSYGWMLGFCFIFILLLIPRGYCGVASRSATSTPTPSPTVEPAAVHATPPLTKEREGLLDRYFNQLKDLDADYEIIVHILEELAKIQLALIYPPGEYEIIGNLWYREANGGTLGELDIVVLDRTAGAAEMVGEVEFSVDRSGSDRGATSDLGRFQFFFSEGRVAWFRLVADTSRVLSPERFENVKEYLRIGNAGSCDAGFDYEVDLTREEADILQGRLLAYKASLAAPAGTTPAVPTPEKKFIGHRRGKVIHYYTCRMPPASQDRVEFSSLEEAFQAGYSRLQPCVPWDLR